MKLLGKITKEIILSDYSYFKKKAATCYSTRQYEDSLTYVKSAAHIAYQLNFRYADNELEDLLQSISQKLIQIDNKVYFEERYVFYDFFGLDNRGLTQQYIHALISWGVSFLYIRENDNNLDLSKSILKSLNEYPKCEIAIISSKLSELEKIKYAAKLIDKFKPSSAFLHLAPWSVVGLCVFNAFPSVKRYLINLTDHAFWLGRSCSDYFIDFRNYGHNVSLKFRGISSDKLLFQPYYPIQDDSTFKGFPLDTSNKVILLTGGSFHKMYGENGKFFDLIKRIINENENVILFIAGSGSLEPMKRFIKKNFFENRILLLGNRSDINEIFKNIDIYLATYPITGGLMAQYAAIHQRNIIAYSAIDLPANFIEDIVRVPSFIKLTYTEEQTFHNEINRLIRDKAYRAQKSKYLSDSIISEYEFNIQLKNLIRKNIPCQLTNIEIPIERMFQLYLEIENNFLHTYYSIIYSTIKLDIFLNPGMGFRFIADVLFNQKLKTIKFVYKKFRSVLKLE